MRWEVVTVIWATSILLETNKTNALGKTIGRVQHHVFWGPWSEWSSCSSTCGQGVSTKSRPCLSWGPKHASNTDVLLCRGRPTRKKLCQSVSCHPTTTTPMPLQPPKDECSELNTLGRVARNHWYMIARSSCVIVCQLSGTQNIQRVNATTDGSSCITHEGLPSFCAGGLCKGTFTASNKTSFSPKSWAATEHSHEVKDAKSKSETGFTHIRKATKLRGQMFTAPFVPIRPTTPTPPLAGDAVWAYLDQEIKGTRRTMQEGLDVIPSQKSPPKESDSDTRFSWKNPTVSSKFPDHRAPLKDPDVQEQPKLPNLVTRSETPLQGTKSDPDTRLQPPNYGTQLVSSNRDTQPSAPNPEMRIEPSEVDSRPGSPNPGTQLESSNRGTQPISPVQKTPTESPNRETPISESVYSPELPVNSWLSETTTIKPRLSVKKPPVSKPSPTTKAPLVVFGDKKVYDILKNGEVLINNIDSYLLNLDQISTHDPRDFSEDLSFLKPFLPPGTTLDKFSPAVDSSRGKVSNNPQLPEIKDDKPKETSVQPGGSNDRRIDTGGSNVRPPYSGRDYELSPPSGRSNARPSYSGSRNQPLPTPSLSNARPPYSGRRKEHSPKPSANNVRPPYTGRRKEHSPEPSANNVRPPYYGGRNQQAPNSNRTNKRPPYYSRGNERSPDSRRNNEQSPNSDRGTERPPYYGRNNGRPPYIGRRYEHPPTSNNNRVTGLKDNTLNNEDHGKTIRNNAHGGEGGAQIMNPTSTTDKPERRIFGENSAGGYKGQQRRWKPAGSPNGTRDEWQPSESGRRRPGLVKPQPDRTGVPPGQENEAENVRPKKRKHKRKKLKKKRKLKEKTKRKKKKQQFSVAPFMSEDCFPCPRASVKDREKQFCESDFVSKVYVNRRKMIGNETRHDITVMSSYRNMASLMQREYLWIESSCRCPNLRAKRTYILMGRMVTRDKRVAKLVLTPQSYVRGFSIGEDKKFKHLVRTVDCVKRSRP